MTQKTVHNPGTVRTELRCNPNVNETQNVPAAKLRNLKEKTTGRNIH